jgi:hypothetical protein
MPRSSRLPRTFAAVTRSSSIEEYAGVRSPDAILLQLRQAAETAKTAVYSYRMSQNRLWFRAGFDRERVSSMAVGEMGWDFGTRSRLIQRVLFFSIKPFRVRFTNASRDWTAAGIVRSHVPRGRHGPASAGADLEGLPSRGPASSSRRTTEQLAARRADSPVVGCAGSPVRVAAGPDGEPLHGAVEGADRHPTISPGPVLSCRVAIPGGIPNRAWARGEPSRPARLCDSTISTLSILASSVVRAPGAAACMANEDFIVE